MTGFCHFVKHIIWQMSTLQNVLWTRSTDATRSMAQYVFTAPSKGDPSPSKKPVQKPLFFVDGQ
jgi:hypothetical protein